MLGKLGITKLLKWFVLAAIAVAIWQGFNGNLGAIAETVWAWVLAGADVVTNIWHAINQK